MNDALSNVIGQLLDIEDYVKIHENLDIVSLVDLSKRLYSTTKELQAYHDTLLKTLYDLIEGKK